MSEHRPRCAARSDSAECICYDLGRERAAAIEDAAQAVEALCIEAEHYDASHVHWESDYRLCANCEYTAAAIRALCSNATRTETLEQEDGA